MSSVYGVDSAYYAVKDIHQTLNIGGAGGGEYVFTGGSSNNPHQLLTWNEWMAWVLFNKGATTLDQHKSIMEKAVYDQEKVLPGNSTTFNRPISIYDVLCADPQLSKFKALVDYTGYGKIWDSPITLFVPLNDHFDEMMEWALDISYKPVAALQILRYHILPFILNPWEMQDRKLKLHTDLDLSIETDWTNGQQLLINPITQNYISPPAGSFTNLSGDDWFPKKDWEVPVLKAIECCNGYIYIIARPVVPADLM